MAGEVVGLVKEKKKLSTSSGQRFLNKAKGVGKVLLRSSLKVGVGVASAGVIKAEGFDDVAKDLSKEISDLTDKYIGEILTKSEEQKGVIAEFREALSSLPDLLQDGTANKPLVFIIDELDRCRPDFALRLLERVKHFFSAPNVHFVLGVNISQLMNSARLAYGRELDSELYLQKFIHISVPIVSKENDRDIHDAEIYISYIFSSLGLDAVEGAEYIRQMVAYVAKNRDLNFRTLERIATSVVFALTTSTNYFKAAPIVAGLAIIKITHPDLYKKAKTGKLKFADVESIFGLEKGSWEEEWWRYAADVDFPQGKVTEFTRGMTRWNFRNRQEIIPFTANVVIDGFSILRR